jgi:hypothetical protein
MYMYAEVVYEWNYFENVLLFDTSHSNIWNLHEVVCYLYHYFDMEITIYMLLVWREPLYLMTSYSCRNRVSQLHSNGLVFQPILVSFLLYLFVILTTKRIAELYTYTYNYIYLTVNLSGINNGKHGSGRNNLSFSMFFSFDSS